MKSLIFLSLLLLTLSINAQEPLDTAAISKLKDEGLSRSQVMEIASTLTDVYGPRLTGTKQLVRAETWAKEQLQKWGLQNVALEPWSPFGKGWELTSFSLQAITPYTSFPVISYPKAWSAAADGKAEVVYFDVKTEDDLKKYKGKLRGKFVMISDFRAAAPNDKPLSKRHDAESLLALSNSGIATQTTEPPVSAEQLKQQQLQYLRTQFLFDEQPLAILDLTYRGTAGSFAISNAILPAKPGTPWYQRPRAYQQSEPVLTQISLNPEHYGRLFRLIQKGIKVELVLSMSVSTYDSPTCYNVIAEIPGTDLKDEIVMLGAHIDSWHSGTGATDNAAGSAIILEAIRLIKASGLQPRRTIRLALWSGEEQGLLGSREYVKIHFGNVPPFGANASTELTIKPEYEKLSGYFNVDNGGGHIRGIYLQQNEACRALFRTWLEPFKDWNATTVSLSNTGGTDHLSFDAIGLPGFQFVQDALDYGTLTHHSNMDTYERLIDEDLKHNAIIVAAIVFQTAIRTDKLPRKPMSTRVGMKP
jgi:carboxypeptidase Q